MKKLTALTVEVIEEAKEMVDFVTKETLSLSSICDMDATEFQMIQKCMTLAEKSMKLAILQAEVMDDINAKMDMLLKKIEE